MLVVEKPLDEIRVVMASHLQAFEKEFESTFGMSPDSWLLMARGRL